MNLFQDDPDFADPPPPANADPARPPLPDNLPPFAPPDMHASDPHGGPYPQRREVQIDPAAIDATFVGAEALGIVCPRCACPDMRVGSTIRQDGAVKRYRYCRACGRGLPTEELSAAALANLRRLAGQ